MRMHVWSFVLAASVIISSACGGGGVPVQSPTTLAAGGSLAHTEQVILDVLPKRGWTTENVQPGRVLAFLAIRSHLLRVEVRYDARQIALYYVDSDNLAASIGADGQVYAHKKVNAWIRRLALDLATALSAAPTPTTGGSAAGAGPAPAPAPPAPTAAPVQ
jgi:hypothetical protein